MEMNTLLVSKKKREKITVNEEFISVATKFLDSKNRITISKKLLNKILEKNKKLDSYQIFIDAMGDILLRPQVSIPVSEAWIYQNHQVIGKIRKGLQDVREGKTERVDDIDAFFDQL